ncbi:MAG: hypothetical protein LBN39_06840 [Planctomycetaceae bacterium]|jgi:hypothetical protein|nr:hypothetical protein [Planctomycetaceae bacterium]
MPKILCISSLVVACLIFLIFLANMLAGIPFGKPDGSFLMNLGMLIGSLVVGVFSALTFLETK